MVSIVDQDIADVSVTLAWEAAPVPESRYEVQLREGDSDEWICVSDKLQSTMVKKKNLKPGTSYSARVRARDSSAQDGWGPFSGEFAFSTLADSSKRMDAPEILVADGEGITVTWKEAPGAATYEVQWRSDQHSSWEVASSTLKGTAVRKKNLKVGVAHYFRVRPSSLADGGDALATWGMSPPSQAAVMSSLSPFLVSIFGSPDAKLVNNAGKEATAKSLAGQVVLLYASASWCGPCRQFTPQLVNWYVQMKAKKHPVEIVLISADRDVKSFKQYLGHMPWFAMEYGSDYREVAMGTLKVQGIPHLAVCGRNGAFIEDKIQPHQLNETSLMRWLQGLKSN
mmetsp:Transcript_45787/g.111480  ORF Transcript_45787/g.111480 Transcript_45787/m.111480 type:complete len:340 (+) Transcript_45787:68-1087(+)